MGQGLLQVHPFATIWCIWMKDVAHISKNKAFSVVYLVFLQCAAVLSHDIFQGSVVR